MLNKSVTIPLPEGVEVREHPLGVAYYEKDEPLIYLEVHPFDCDSIRRLVWYRWLNKQSGETHRCKCALVSNENQ